MAADDGGLDDERLPLPRRTQRPGDDGVFHVFGGLRLEAGRWRLEAGGWRLEAGRWGHRGSIVLRSLSRPPTSILQPPGALAIRRDEFHGPRRFLQPRDLREREVFREASRGQPLARARE